MLTINVIILFSFQPYWSLLSVGVDFCGGEINIFLFYVTHQIIYKICIESKLTVMLIIYNKLYMCVIISSFSLIMLQACTRKGGGLLKSSQLGEGSTR